MEHSIVEQDRLESWTPSRGRCEARGSLNRKWMCSQLCSREASTASVCKIERRLGEGKPLVCCHCLGKTENDACLMWQSNKYMLFTFEWVVYLHASKSKAEDRKYVCMYIYLCISQFHTHTHIFSLYIFKSPLTHFPWHLIPLLNQCYHCLVSPSQHFHAFMRQCVYIFFHLPIHYFTHTLLFSLDSMSQRWFQISI